jgi:hypothetical protein
MAHTSRGRVILGGLLAGVVINVVEFVTNALVLKQDWGQTLQALGKPAEPSGGAILTFNIWGFLLGIAAVWLYAAIRPRYGQGVGTAIRAALAAWALVFFLPSLNMLPLGIFPTRLIVVPSIMGLIELTIATIAGAWLYKEDAGEVSTVRSAAA